MEEKVQLMYKQPGMDEHQDITEVLDEIIHRLDRLENLLETVYEELING